MPPSSAGRLSADDDLSTVLELERELQTAECRRDRERLASLLADDFTEVGASGTVWDKSSILDMLGSESSVEIEVIELSGRVIGSNCVLVQWISRTAELRARRTSLWRRTDTGWELVHHQGTPIG
ncbi:nuclear transport factor 2 family protein [Rhodococcus sp. IEGM 1330]|uniref:nuclear transport factor 2 family protein n=1 Tax=Rhodococcus sp. IEGM 1330 TaxID=3082225 RepID=UPI002955ABD9|nr:nuclear transport factor 2 family protein [Rhodococcus sp. IEGM 1330]MDV8021822.1 nuclear transport factor 2 family protein [Rhodococcus sp. IEGM 1330]